MRREEELLMTDSRIVDSAAAGLGRRLIGAAALTTFAALCLAAPPAHGQVEDDLREGDRYFEEGKYKRAAQRYDSAIERSPGQVSAEAYGQRAAIFIIQKNYRGGLHFIESQAEAQHPGTAEVLEQKALILWLLERREDAIEVAEKVVAKKPEAYSNQGILGEFYAGRDSAKAIVALEAFFRHRPDSLERNDVLPRARLGFAYLAVQRYRDAEGQFELLLKKHRRQRHAEVNARNGLCAAYAALGKYDRAITVCEQIVRSPRQIDRSGSVWYNLGQAYLSKRQTKRARSAGIRFIQMRRDSPKGYILVGDSHFQAREWAKALQYYLDAKKRVKDASASDIAVELGIKLGATYRRLDRPDEAITVLEAASAVNPSNVELASELGTVYLSSREDEKAIAVVEKLITDEAFAAMAPADKVKLLLIAGQGLYNSRQLDKATERYRTAYKLRKSDLKVRIRLVQAVNLQAYQALTKGRLGIATRRLEEAYTIDKSSTTTNRNLAVLALRQKRCDSAKKYLAALEKAPGTKLLYHRLLARAFLCQRQPDRRKAILHYALAEKRALDPNVQANLLRAEIYTEWAPLIFESDLDDAIAKLETAVQLAARNPEVGNAARRNLALASYRRGWRHLEAGKLRSAIADFQTARREPRVLRGSEKLVFEFALAIAYVENGETGRATRIFSRLIGKSQRGGYLRAPYDRVGVRFFDAYAKYRSGNRRSMRLAAKAFSRLQGRARGEFAAKLRDLTAATWLTLAREAWRVKNSREVKEALGNAARYASSGKLKRVVENNRGASSLGDRGIPRNAMSRLQALSDSPPEALANMGILYDRMGKPKQAYDLWLRARQRGVRSRSVQQWIDSKKRMFGF